MREKFLKDDGMFNRKGVLLMAAIGFAGAILLNILNRIVPGKK